MRKPVPNMVDGVSSQTLISSILDGWLFLTLQSLSTELREPGGEKDT